MCEAIYDSASEGTELLAEKDALPYRHVAPVPDYFAELETVGATGRVLFPKDGAPSMSDGGRVATRTLSAACRRDGVDIKTGHRVQKVTRNDKGEVIGVEAKVEGGGVFRARARKAVARAIAAGDIDRGPCRMCGTDENIEMHHPNGYEGAARLDVVPLCGPCHRAVHAPSSDAIE